MRIEPPISDPIPNGEPAAACMQPSPPEEPPTICLKIIIKNSNKTRVANVTTGMRCAKMYDN